MNENDFSKPDFASAVNPFSDMPLSDRKKIIASEICSRIESDVWLWFTGEVHQENTGDSMVTSFVDGGFRNEQERANFFRVIIHPDLTPTATAPLALAMGRQESITRCREQLVTDAVWSDSQVGKIWSELGFNDFIISAFPVGKSGYSALGFHRRLHRPRFTNTEAAFVDTVSTCLGWIHGSSKVVQASTHVLELSPRERQVIMFLINGDSKKQVAAKLAISEYTVGDYLKEIYRKFGVNSRSELLSKFISGDAQM